MTNETAEGLGWWLASDGSWYPPEQHPNATGRTSARDWHPAGSALRAAGAPAPVPSVPTRRSVAVEQHLGDAPAPVRSAPAATVASSTPTHSVSSPVPPPEATTVTDPAAVPAVAPQAAVPAVAPQAAVPAVAPQAAVPPERLISPTAALPTIPVPAMVPSAATTPAAKANSVPEGAGPQLPDLFEQALMGSSLADMVRLGSPGLGAPADGWDPTRPRRLPDESDVPHNPVPAGVGAFQGARVRRKWRIHH